MNKERCPNMNHGRSNSAVCFCPTCGARFTSLSKASCNEIKHASRRKERSTFCIDCGLRLAHRH